MRDHIISSEVEASRLVDSVREQIDQSAQSAEIAVACSELRSAD